MNYLWEETARTDTDPYYQKCGDSLLLPCNSGASGPAITGKRVYEFKAKPEREGQILRWIREHPDTPQGRLLEANLVHPREIRRYLDGMAAEGLVRSARKKIRGAHGERTCRVWEIVPPPPDPRAPQSLEDLLKWQDM